MAVTADCNEERIADKRRHAWGPRLAWRAL